MTETEIENKADEWVELTYDRCYYPDSNYSARIDARNAFIAGAKEMQEENEELKAQIEELKKENAELKQYAKALEETDDTNILHCMKVNGKLYKAKEIIKDYMIIAKGAHITVCGVPEENRTIYVLKLNKEAEQFLNCEVEK